ncbi:MAG TPA: type IV toxin-antitoxin system AbiEi family antitoxin [Longimicrobiaceae bacterium]|nr:type IV toxin-antitoxin system AbiEi family antitoxin [Longimicrobiaceae bacterium]
MKAFPAATPLLQKALDLLARNLGPGIGVGARTPDRKPGLPVHVRTGSGRKEVAVRLVEPNSAESFATGANVVRVLARASQAVRQGMRERGESFVDLSGAVHLNLPGLLIDRSDLEPATRGTADAQPFADPFADRASMVPRLLLASPERVWGVRELASAVGTGLGSTSRVVRSLAARGLVRAEREGRSSRIRVDDPVRLFERWAAIYDWTRNRSQAFHAPIGSVDRFVRRLPDVFGETGWALTMHAGASRIAPHAVQDDDGRVHVYVDAANGRAMAELGRAAGWTPASDGRVVLMKPYYKTSAWFGVQEADGMPIVSTLQLALDLWQYPVRGREQAEHLLQAVLGWADG